jgi:Second Messenger Oligonucleotide or Dinucleotide Synthetase domain
MVTTVIGGFGELLERLTITDDQRSTASSRVSGIRDFFSDTFVIAEKALTIGSYERGTLVRWERDIDLLAPLSVAESWAPYKDNSRDFLYMVRGKLNDEYATTRVSSRKVAAVLDFTVIRCEVVPAFRRQGGGYLIPDGSGGWQATNPPYHQQLMKAADDTHEGKLKPLVKLMKAWKIANALSLSSLHVELLTEQLWRNSTIGDHPSSVASTLAHLPSRLQSSYTDPWASGAYIDAQLSADNREAAVKTAQADASTSASAESARKKGETSNAFKHWDTVYRQKFPALG